MGRAARRIKKAYRRISEKIKNSKIAHSKFIEKAKDIMNSKPMKIALPILSILSMAAAPAALGMIVAKAAYNGATTVNALMAAYQVYVMGKGVKTIVDLAEEDKVRDGLDKIFDLFRRRDLGSAPALSNSTTSKPVSTSSSKPESSQPSNPVSTTYTKPTTSTSTLPTGIKYPSQGSFILINGHTYSAPTGTTNPLCQCSFKG